MIIMDKKAFKMKIKNLKKKTKKYINRFNSVFPFVYNESVISAMEKNLE